MTNRVPIDFSGQHADITMFAELSVSSHMPNLEVLIERYVSTPDNIDLDPISVGRVFCVGALEEALPGLMGVLDVTAQHPAAYSFTRHNGFLSPQKTQHTELLGTITDADAEVELRELRRKVVEFTELLEKFNNYDPRIIRSVKLLADALPDNTIDINPCLIRLRSLIVGEYERSFANSDELPCAIKSHFSDIAEHTHGLVACYVIAHREGVVLANELAHKLVNIDTDQILCELSTLRDTLAKAVETVAADTVVVFDTMSQIPEDGRQFVGTNRGKLWLAARMLVAGNCITELIYGSSDRHEISCADAPSSM